MSTSNREIAQKLQERLEFYLIALAFTVLALAIQTATFGNHLISDLTELLGWATLLVSGAIGLIRLEIFPIAYEKHASLKELEHEVHQYEVLKDQGNKTVRLSLENAEEVSIDALLSDRKNAIVALQPVIKNLEQKIRSRYVIHKWSFFFGIVLIAISRAVPGILAIADQL